MVRRPGTALDELRGSDPMEWGEEEFDADGEGFFYMNSYGEEVSTTEINPALLEFMDDETLKNIIGSLLRQKETVNEDSLEWLEQFKKYD